jgi:hypothetical protein
MEDESSYLHDKRYAGILATISPANRKTLLESKNPKVCFCNYYRWDDSEFGLSSPFKCICETVEAGDRFFKGQSCINKDKLGCVGARILNAKYCDLCFVLYKDRKNELVVPGSIIPAPRYQFKKLTAKAVKQRNGALINAIVKEFVCIGPSDFVIMYLGYL